MAQTASQSELAAIRERLAEIQQEHLLTFYDELDPDRRRHLLDHLSKLDFERIERLREFALSPDAHSAIPSDLSPAPYYPADAASTVRPWDRDDARAVGESLIRAGKVAAFTVAGGQGTRLGFDGPKGCYPAGAVTGKPLFQMLAEQVLAASRKYGVAIQWRLMTSPLNHDATIACFREYDYFGLDPDQVGFFQQGVLPSFDDTTGRILLAEKEEPATNPDGHGGSLKALYTSGAIDDLQSRGVEHLSYTQIDNPLVHMFDPAFIGLHAEAPDSSGEMSSKMIAKSSPDEKVGVFCVAGGKLQVIEYSDLPSELAHERDERGELRFNAGSPAIHVISLDFVRRLNESEGGFALPLHRAHKKVAHIDLASGKRIEPESPNAIKLETFVFDALPMCRSSIVLETDRFEFAPIKNASGPDSAETSHRLQTERAASWLERRHVRIPRKPDGSADCVIELSPLTALAADDLANHNLPPEIERGSRVAL